MRAHVETVDEDSYVVVPVEEVKFGLSHDDEKGISELGKFAHNEQIQPEPAGVI